MKLNLIPPFPIGQTRLLLSFSIALECASEWVCECVCVLDQQMRNREKVSEVKLRPWGEERPSELDNGGTQGGREIRESAGKGKGWFLLPDPVLCKEVSMSTNCEGENINMLGHAQSVRFLILFFFLSRKHTATACYYFSYSFAFCREDMLKMALSCMLVTCVRIKRFGTNSSGAKKTWVV